MHTLYIKLKGFLLLGRVTELHIPIFLRGTHTSKVGGLSICSRSEPSISSRPSAPLPPPFSDKAGPAPRSAAVERGFPGSAAEDNVRGVA